MGERAESRLEGVNRKELSVSSKKGCLCAASVPRPRKSQVLLSFKGLSSNASFFYTRWLSR